MRKQDTINKVFEHIKDLYDLVTISGLDFKGKNILYKKISKLDHEIRSLFGDEKWEV